MKTIKLASILLVATFGSSIGSSALAGVKWSQAKPHAESAAECSTIDYREDVGPARNQGNIGWCYANVTADLLTFHYRDQLRGQRVSAGYTALIYNKDTSENPLGEGGAVHQAMQFASREGLCPESLEQEVLSHGPRVQIKQKLEAFVKFKDLYDQAKTDPKAKAEFQKQVTAYRSSNSSLFRLKSQEILNLLANTTRKNFTLEFSRMICRGHKIEAAPPYPVMRSIDKQSLARYWIELSPYIHQQLEAGKPVAVGYAAQFLSHEKVPKWAFSWTNNLMGRNDDVSRHASLIVGRRWNGKSCEFILRNSWGTGCGYGNKHFRSPEKCEGGHLFVNEKFMETQMYRIFYFSDSFVGDILNRADAVIN